MANSTITTPTGPSTIPSPTPGADVPKQPLVPRGVVPGEDIPLPDQAPGTAGNAPANASTRTSAPTVNFNKDQVQTTPNQGPSPTALAADGPAGRPFSEYPLPPSEQAVKGQRPEQTNELA